MVTERIMLMTNLPSYSQVAKKTASFIVSCLANPGLHVPRDVTLLSLFYLGPFLNCQHPLRHLRLVLAKRSILTTAIAFVPLWLSSIPFPALYNHVSVENRLYPIH